MGVCHFIIQSKHTIWLYFETTQLYEKKQIKDMRQITALAINAFNNNYNFKRDNTEIRTSSDKTEMRLHGNLIAEKSFEGIYISTCGWPSMTTKERLNGLYGVNIVQRNYDWYLNGKLWDGQRIKVH